MMRDEAFYSAALDREMRYRVILPAVVAPGQMLATVYLLHGAGGDSRDWSDNSDVARYAEGGLVLIMPQGDYSYFVNAAGRAKDRYEDYIVQDLPSAVEKRFPVAKTRANRAIVGISMGGFGALKIALSHPDLFAFAGALSPPVDAPRRGFSLRRIHQSLEFRSLFGPPGTDENRRRDLFFIARNVVPAQTPYLFLSCGERESLLPVNRQFAVVLEKQHLPFEFHVVEGSHDWGQWNKQLPALFESLHQHLGRKS